MASLVKSFVRWNIKACDWIERRLLPAAFTRSLLARHELLAAQLLNARPGQVVLDVGGGHLCPFAQRRTAQSAAYVIASDILHEQLVKNRVADGCAVADACIGLPFRDASIDLLVTRSVLEHLPDTRRFFAEAARVTRPGGYQVHVCPARNAPFAVLNRLLPGWLVHKALYFVFPQWRDECGFKAYYDNCTHGEMTRILRASGLEVEQVHLRYYQSIYFKFLVPLYLAFVTYDLLVWMLDLKALCCQMLLVAKRPERPGAVPLAA